MTKRRWFFGLILLFALTAVQAHAGLILEYQGGTGVGSSWGTTAIDAGTSFRIDVGFPETPVLADPEYPGIGLYGIDWLRVEVGRNSYTPTVLPDYVIVLVDASYGLFNAYEILFGRWGNGGVFSPDYRTATPSSWSATAPTPVVFSDYRPASEYSVPFDISGTTLRLDFDYRVGVNTSILATPEPTAFLLALTGLAAIGLIRRR